MEASFAKLPLMPMIGEKLGSIPNQIILEIMVSAIPFLLNKVGKIIWPHNLEIGELSAYYFIILHQL